MWAAVASEITIGSMCSGIGGLELGLKAGFESRGFKVRTIWQCEQDQYCRAVLARHFPESTIYEDVNSDAFQKAIQKEEQPDYVCFGFPCQDLSVAGHQKGIHGARSSLFFRCWELSMLVRPRPTIIMENVSNITVNGALSAVLGTIHASGYNAEWCMLSAAECGARHRRKRWFLVANPDTVGQS